MKAFQWSVREIARASFLAALGIALPYLFHLIGAGKIFLPMHIPIALGGFLLPPTLAGFLGGVVPFLSSVLTGMPPIVPTMPLMVLELTGLGFTTSILYRRLKAGIWLSLIGGLIGDRIVLGFAAFLLGKWLEIKSPIGYVAGAVATGFPGILLQLILIPPIIYYYEKRN
ncbi:ECF transporter S component [bacterium]|nr:ECF transporter S component [bacterium]